MFSNYVSDSVKHGNNHKMPVEACMIVLKKSRQHNYMCALWFSLVKVLRSYWTFQKVYC